jgi:hypothetical protein
MRKWHRWISVFFGFFLLFIAATGIASHAVKIYMDGGLSERQENRRPPDKASMVSVPDQNGVAAKPAPNPMRKWLGFFHHLHSGETFGPIGTVISLLSGFALLFFAVSGLWMYVQMFLRRSKTGNSRYFWD